MTVSELALKFIIGSLGENKKVYFGLNSSKSICVTPSVFKKWSKSGIDLFKIDSDGNLRIAQGKVYNIICAKTHSLVKISAV